MAVVVRGGAGRSRLRWWGLGGATLALAVTAVAALAWGPVPLDGGQVWRGLQDPTSAAGVLLYGVRIPRAIAAVLLGATLALSGAIVQGLTGNRLASPSLLGVNAGAAFGLVAFRCFSGTDDALGGAIAAFVGGGGTAALAFILGRLGDRQAAASSLRLILAGIAASSALSALTMGALLLDDRAWDEVQFWLAGSLAGIQGDLLKSWGPVAAIGLGGAVLLARPLTILELGTTTARSLGARTGWIQAIGWLTAVLLASSAVAVAGPVSFVGLVVPNAVRSLAGAAYGWRLAYAALGGAWLVLGSDTVGRIARPPLELPVGMILAMVGAPIAIALVSHGQRSRGI